MSAHRLRIACTILVVGLWFAGTQYLRFNGASMSADAALMQLENSDQAYTESQTSSNPYFLQNLLNIGALVLLAVTWLPLALQGEKRKIGAFSMLLLLAACGPTKDIYKIKPNESGFLIPLTGDTTTQSSTRTLDFYQENQVFVKEVMIDKRWVETGTGRGEWRPAAELIIINRTPVTRHWTQEANTGTSTSNQGFPVETRESIGVTVGVVCSASIEESKAPAFLYFWGTASLETVMDNQVRLYIQQVLFEEFGKRTLDEARNQKADIFNLTFQKTRDYFADKGITIMSLGGAEGLIYNNPQVQDAIDRAFVAEQEIQAAEARATQQAIENTTFEEQMFSQARVAATATYIAGEAAAAVDALTGSTINQYPNIINYMYAQRWNGQLPQMMGNTNAIPFLNVTLEPPTTAGQ